MFFLPESFHLLLPTHLNTTATVLQLQEASYSFNLAHSKIFERGGASAPKVPPLNPPLHIFSAACISSVLHAYLLSTYIVSYVASQFNYLVD